ncbi:VIT1/CCC1 transporter family protein [Porphyrobacter sp. LM 6]|jgi:VIT1/CCC1 family predicted Fe2+/Mn2+ transporter|uniref:VIT1/CCC1 transporter family protein n=1 Tax=Porphyrobacter sp. LM 6 TaxID=1896196 RepID=UPI000847D3AC|nr:VIT family protein [Porphyrobacter sp. LM 6]AOL94108.1 Fe2+/Mn2+ transporter, VIT1/CCC1 family [Porphyrobacter sp. LM 6]
MTQPSAHPDDPHYVHRTGWLRAAVLGANDGIISTSSLIIGVAAATPEVQPILVAGVAGLMAGAMSMAAGEYISVSSQRDSEQADIKREREALVDSPEMELEELAAVYRSRGLSAETAATVARELSALDPLAAHVRDELGLSEHLAARPLQAAIASGATFSAAAAVPLLAAYLAPANAIILTVVTISILSLAVLGALGAKAGAAPLVPAVLRVVGWGAFAMAVTAGVGRLFGVSV